MGSNTNCVLSFSHFTIEMRSLYTHCTYFTMNCAHVAAAAEPYLLSEFLRFAYLSEFLGLCMSKESYVALQSLFLLLVPLFFYSLFQVLCDVVLVIGRRNTQ